MRFSVAALIPLPALAVPALSTSVQARDDSYGGVEYKGKDRHNDGGSKDYNYGNKDHGRKDCTWEPVFEHKKDFKGWNKGKYTPYEHKEVDKITFEIDKRISSFLSLSPTSCLQNASPSARRMTSATPARVRLMFLPLTRSLSHIFIVYSKDKSDDKFVCELFVEIIDIETWEDDCDDGKDYKDGKGRKDGKKDDKDDKDGHKYYDTSCWNAHYNY
ncbi:uncharacterized protein ARMOST_01544 [Armillaria ostoyae]|uniref:Uncharacterized protein n=1 Tax=Armillaria ostoyae TaxID=47428 RepID=A0A284QP94_ARMOS|nr:uncharacterized protein ARMOST_01544 [Armillaria ostoyae]